MNLFRDPIAALAGAQNPPVLRVHSGFSGSVRLAFEPLTKIQCRSRFLRHLPGSRCSLNDNLFLRIAYTHGKRRFSFNAIFCP